MAARALLWSAADPYYLDYYAAWLGFVSWPPMCCFAWAPIDLHGERWRRAAAAGYSLILARIPCEAASGTIP